MSDECDGYFEFYSEYFRTARKQHKCCECNMMIDPGDKYVACAGKYEGRMEMYKQHLVCYHIARFVNLELFARWPERLADHDERIFCFIWHPIEYARFFNEERHGFDLTMPDRKQRNACIGFGGIDECLGYTDDYENENCVDVKSYWSRWLSGVKETFQDGSGI